MEQLRENRKILSTSIGSMLLQEGFDAVDKESLGTLTEMMQCFISEIGSLTRNYCELAGRTEPLNADLVVALAEMGIEQNTLCQGMKYKHSALPPIQPQSPQTPFNMISAGTKQPLPPYIPQHMPQFPDPYAYIRTPTYKQPVIDYESVREKASIQKKNTEKALTKFLAKTNETLNLLDTDEANIFPLIVCKPTYPPYSSALLPQDQIFDAEDLEYDHKSQMIQQSKKRKSKGEHDEEENDEETLNDPMKSEENTNSNMYIDNPYLAATKLPKKDEMIVNLNSSSPCRV